MNKIQLDDTIRAKLNGMSEELEVCDSSGQVVGRFVPESIYQKYLYAWVLSQRPPLSPEEELRRRNAKGGMPLQEILKRLEKLP